TESARKRDCLPGKTISAVVDSPGTRTLAWAAHLVSELPSVAASSPFRRDVAGSPASTRSLAPYLPARRCSQTCESYRALSLSTHPDWARTLCTKSSLTASRFP